MAMTCIAALIAAASIGAALFGGIVPPDALTGQVLSVALAAVTAVAVASAAALDI
ncbi:hypothetical protein [Bosea sp. AAP35]|uniref:hypothetical protein n=1 Tax=Bosea sp. AAP35 TaxID=1523417 RepID=UPI000B176458|nr:hypothetical protein [Bosea sp. AAP35]